MQLIARSRPLTLTPEGFMGIKSSRKIRARRR
jgi:hypothetical protein